MFSDAEIRELIAKGRMREYPASALQCDRCGRGPRRGGEPWLGMGKEQASCPDCVTLKKEEATAPR